MVVTATDRMHDTVIELLTMFREALKNSKQRAEPGTDMNEVITHYYKMPSGVASDLVGALPTLVAPGTWADPPTNEQPGSVWMLTSKNEAIEKKGEPTTSEPRSVLLIRQRRSVHKEIDKVLTRVLNGDPPLDGGFGPGSGSFGGGGQGFGFGGGYFQIPAPTEIPSEQ